MAATDVKLFGKWYSSNNSTDTARPSHSALTFSHRRTRQHTAIQCTTDSNTHCHSP